MSDLSTATERDAYYRALGEVASLQDHVRRWQVLAALTTVIGLTVAGSWAWGLRDSAEERDLKRQARAAVTAWEQTLERAGRGPLTDEDLERAGIDAGGPDIRMLVDEFTGMLDYSTGPIEVDYHVQAVAVHAHGVVDVNAWIGFYYPTEQLGGEQRFSSGSEGRYLTFVEASNGLRLVRDVSDGHGHGGLTP